MKAKIIRHLLFMLIASLVVFNLNCSKGCKDENVKQNQVGKKEGDTVTVPPIKPKDGKAGCSQLLKAGNKNLNSIMFMSPFRGIAVGDSGKVIITMNGGNTWFSPAVFVTDKNLYGVSAGDLNNIVAVGSEGTILRSIDGGINWTSVPVETQQTIRSVAFYSPTGAFAVGDSGVAFSTHNGGANWQKKLRGNASEILYGISYNSSNDGRIVGNNGLVYQDTSFSSSTTIGGGAINLRSVHFALNTSYYDHTNVGFIVGDGGNIFKSTNGGNTWTPEVSNTGNNLRSVFLTNEHWGYAVGVSGTILRYNGSVWKVLPQLSGANLNGVDNGEVYSVTEICVGDDGTVGIVCPDHVPGTTKSVTTNPINCGNWSFDLVLDDYDEGDPLTGAIVFHSLTVSSSHSINIERIAAGWGVHDSFGNPHDHYGEYLFTQLPHPSPPFTYTLNGFVLSSTTTEAAVYVTCCLRDASGNPWLLNKFQCPPQ